MTPEEGSADRRSRYRRTDDALLYNLHREVGVLQAGQDAILTRLDVADHGRARMRHTLHEISNELQTIASERRLRYIRRERVVKVLKQPLTWLATAAAGVLTSVGTGWMDWFIGLFRHGPPPGPPA